MEPTLTSDPHTLTDDNIEELAKRTEGYLAEEIRALQWTSAPTSMGRDALQIHLNILLDIELKI